jgi:AcrR family transcriptional regulator
MTARLSRTESQARTRSQLVATAKELFLRDGYLATSLEKVAETAGFSKGAVYSNFRNKDELCVAVLDEIRAERAAEILALAQDGGTIEERLARFEAWAEQVIGDPAWTSLELEFGVQVRGNGSMGRMHGARFQAMAQLVEQGLGLVADSEGIEPPMPTYEVAVALLCMGVGLGLFRSLDRSIPVSALTNTLRVLAGLDVPQTAPQDAPRDAPHQSRSMLPG